MSTHTHQRGCVHCAVLVSLPRKNPVSNRHNLEPTKWHSDAQSNSRLRGRQRSLQTSLVNYDRSTHQVQSHLHPLKHADNPDITKSQFHKAFTKNASRAYSKMECLQGGVTTHSCHKAITTVSQHCLEGPTT